MYFSQDTCSYRKEIEQTVLEYSDKLQHHKEYDQVIGEAKSGKNNK